METTQNKQEPGSNGTQANNAQPNFGGFDFNSLIGNPGMMEFLKHLLSGAGAMAGNYFMWIKPMQDKMDIMNNKLIDQEKRIRELEHQVEDLEIICEGSQNNQEKTNKENLTARQEDYFDLKQKNPQRFNYPKRKGLKF